MEGKEEAEVEGNEKAEVQGEEGAEKQFLTLVLYPKKSEPK